MTYKLNKVDDPESCIERQAKTIQRLKQEKLTIRRDFEDACDVITQLETEKAELTQALNNASKRINMRPDQNWDGGFRAEVSE